MKYHQASQSHKASSKKLTKLEPIKQQLRQMQVWKLIRFSIIAPFGIVCALGFIAYFDRAQKSIVSYDGALFLVFSLLLIFFLGVTYTSVQKIVRPKTKRLVIYTKTRLEGYFLRTFGRGKAIAEGLFYLEELAEEKNLTPLSKFGFHDDFYHQSVTWHKPEEGLLTISALKKQLKVSDTQEQPKELQELQDDLTAWEDVLSDAIEKQVLFCIQLRLGTEAEDTQVASLEAERRTGYFT